MEPPNGTLKIEGRVCPVAHIAFVLIPPEESDNSHSLYLHADALAAGGGFLMLDHLQICNVTKLEDFAGARISFHGDESDSNDTVGSEPSDLETSGWTFPGFEDDDGKNWHFETFSASIEHRGGKLLRITIKCELSNWANDERLEGEADLECIAAVGTPPCFDPVTSTWSESGS